MRKTNMYTRIYFIISFLNFHIFFINYIIHLPCIILDSFIQVLNDTRNKRNTFMTIRNSYSNLISILAFNISILKWIAQNHNFFFFFRKMIFTPNLFLNRNAFFLIVVVIVFSGLVHRGSNIYYMYTAFTSNSRLILTLFGCDILC